MTPDPLRYEVKQRDETMVTVFAWPDLDPWYASVLLRLPGGYEARLSPADAQRLGHALNNAGRGVLPPASASERAAEFAALPEEAVVAPETREETEA